MASTVERRWVYGGSHLTDHNIVHELVQREVLRRSREASLLHGALAVEVAPPWEHPMVLIVPLEQAPPDLHKESDLVSVHLKESDTKALTLLCTQ